MSCCDIPLNPINTYISQLSLLTSEPTLFPVVETMDLGNSRFMYDEIVVEMGPPPHSPGLSPRNSKCTKTSHSPKTETVVDPLAFPRTHSLLDKLKTAYGNADIGPLRLNEVLRKCDSALPQESNNPTKTLMVSLRLQFQWIAHTLNYMHSDESRSFLNFFERLTLSDFIAGPPMFACAPDTPSCAVRSCAVTQEAEDRRHRQCLLGIYQFRP